MCNTIYNVILYCIILSYIALYCIILYYKILYYVYRVKVREDMPVGTVITNLVAHDADLPASGGEVTYKIVKGMYLIQPTYLCYTCVIGAIGQ